MIGSEEPSRNLAALAVPRRGSLAETGEPFEPFRLLDPSGQVVGPVRERDTLTAGYHAQLNAAEQIIAAQRARAERAEHQVDTERAQNRLSTTPGPDPAAGDTHPSPSKQRSRTRAAGQTVA
jgi:hypothetical protein